jgi:hypothetical protein
MGAKIFFYKPPGAGETPGRAGQGEGLERGAPAYAKALSSSNARPAMPPKPLALTALNSMPSTVPPRRSMCAIAMRF